MGARPKVVLLGFDACDIGIVRAMADAGKLPAFRTLLDSWAAAKIRNPYGLFVNSLWTSFFTAGPAALAGFHCWETIEPGTYKRRLMTPRELVGRPFWRALSEAGRRVAVLDVPHARAESGINGLEVVEYGCHDRHFGFHTSPPELAREILGRFGPHPVFTVDAFQEREFAPDDYVHRQGPHRTADEEKALLRDMLDGLDRKTRLSTWLLGQGGWDLFVSVFGESHAIGHQQWYLHDPAHPRHDAALAREMGDPLEQVYASLDRALAAHLALAGEDSTVVVLLSHGMGPHYDGTHLLDEILARIDAADLRWPRGRPDGQVISAVWRYVRGRARAMRTPSAEAARRRIRRSPPKRCFVGDVGPAERAHGRFFLSPNNTVYGGVRINLEGRERAGIVRPGSQFDATCEQLQRDLLALVNLGTGVPAVRSVERTDAHHARASMDGLPDLFVDWNHEAPIETVWSPKTGIVHAPYENWRTGDHHPGGFLLASGPGIPPRRDFGEIAIGDLGPAICALLGVELDAHGGGTALTADSVS